MVKIRLVIECALELLGWYRFKRSWYRWLIAHDLFDPFKDSINDANRH